MYKRRLQKNAILVYVKNLYKNILRLLLIIFCDPFSPPPVNLQESPASSPIP